MLIWNLILGVKCMGKKCCVRRALHVDPPFAKIDNAIKYSTLKLWVIKMWPFCDSSECTLKLCGALGSLRRVLLFIAQKTTELRKSKGLFFSSRSGLTTRFCMVANHSLPSIFTGSTIVVSTNRGSKIIQKKKMLFAADVYLRGLRLYRACRFFSRHYSLNNTV